MLPFPIQHQCKFGEYPALPCIPLVSWNLISPGDSIKYSPFRSNVLQSGRVYIHALYIKNSSFPFLSPLFPPFVHAFAGGGLGPSWPQDVFADFGCCRVNMLLIQVLKALTVAQTLEGAKQVMYGQVYHLVASLMDSPWSKQVYRVLTICGLWCTFTCVRGNVPPIVRICTQSAHC